MMHIKSLTAICLGGENCKGKDKSVMDYWQKLTIGDVFLCQWFLLHTGLCTLKLQEIGREIQMGS